MLSTVKWPEWHMAEVARHNIAGVSGDPGDAGYFIFKKKGCAPNEYYHIHPQNSERLRMGSDSTGNVSVGPLSEDDTSGQWKIEPKGSAYINENGCQRHVSYYQFTPVCWSNWHMYVDSDPTGNVRGICGDNPGQQAQILFKKLPC